MSILSVSDSMDQPFCASGDKYDRMTQKAATLAVPNP
jgi:hypothetical protein